MRVAVSLPVAAKRFAAWPLLNACEQVTSCMPADPVMACLQLCSIGVVLQVYALWVCVTVVLG